MAPGLRTLRRSCKVAGPCVLVAVACFLAWPEGAWGRGATWAEGAAGESPSAQRALQGVCLRDYHGNINCVSTNDSDEGGSEGYGQRAEAPPESQARERGPAQRPDTVEIEGCAAKLPARFDRAMDRQTYVRGVLNDFLEDPQCEYLGPALLTLAFRDSCTFTLDSRGFLDNGANGSIRLELHEPFNQDSDIRRAVAFLEGLRDFLLAMSMEISYADLVQLGAAQAVEAAGGPVYSVKLGRLDAAVPDVYDTNPTDNDSVQTRMAKFIAMGMGLRDFVALMGANTLGSSDSSTPRVFDSALFKDISSSNALRAADASLMNDPRTASWVSWFVSHEDEFFLAFAEAMVKLSELNSKWA